MADDQPDNPSPRLSPVEDLAKQFDEESAYEKAQREAQAKLGVGNVSAYIDKKTLPPKVRRDTLPNVPKVEFNVSGAVPVVATRALPATTPATNAPKSKAELTSAELLQTAEITGVDMVELHRSIADTQRAEQAARDEAAAKARLEKERRAYAANPSPTKGPHRTDKIDVAAVAKYAEKHTAHEEAHAYDSSAHVAALVANAPAPPSERRITDKMPTLADAMRPRAEPPASTPPTALPSPWEEPADSSQPLSIPKDALVSSHRPNQVPSDEPEVPKASPKRERKVAWFALLAAPPIFLLLWMVFRSEGARPAITIPSAMTNSATARLSTNPVPPSATPTIAVSTPPSASAPEAQPTATAKSPRVPSTSPARRPNPPKTSAGDPALNE